MLCVFLSLSITAVSATIYYKISASILTGVTFSPVGFKSGEDTSFCGGSFNATNAEFTCIPLTIASNITITQLLNISNMDSSDHFVEFFVTENFGSELSLLSLYLVLPSGVEILVVSINDSGIVVTENVLVNIPQKEEWAIKLEGHYDEGTPLTQSNTMSLKIQVLN